MMKNNLISFYRSAYELIQSPIFVHFLRIEIESQ